MRVVSMLKHSLVILLIAIFISAPVMAIDAKQRTDVTANWSTTILSTTRHPATLYTINPTKPDYDASEDIQVNIFTDAAGVLENEIGANSIPIPRDASTKSLGRVPSPGLYFTRFRVGGETFTNGFLVLPAGGTRFTVEKMSEPACTAPVTQAQTEPIKKFFRNLTAARMQTAAGAVAPRWFAINGQNFVVQLAKGIVLVYSGIGFIAIIAENGLARDILALAVDFVGTVLTRAAEDMSPAVLTPAERDLVKLVLSGLNNVIQTILAEGLFQRIVTLGQAVNEVTLGSDADSQVLAKVVGDTVKKFEVLIRLKRP